MKENKLALVASVVVIGVAGAQSAAANEPGFYIGGYFGQASKDADKFPFVDLTQALQEFAVFQPVDEVTSFDDTDTAYGLFGGYRLNRYLAFEAAYSKLGKVSYKSRATGNFPQEPGSLATTVETETSGFSVAVLGTLPLNRNWDVLAKGGVLFGSNTFRFDLKAQGDVFVPPTGPHISDSLSDGSTDYFASLGISHRILEIYDVRLEYQRVFDAGVETAGSEADVDLVLL